MIEMLWTPKQYRRIFSDLYDKSDKNAQIAIDHRLDFLIENGNRSRRPYSEHLRNEIFELRAKDLRFLFYFGPEKEIVFVNAIVKKKGPVGNDAIDEAEKRMNRIRNGEEGVNDV